VFDTCKHDRQTHDPETNDRRLVPICDRLFDILQPLRRESGPVVSLKSDWRPLDAANLAIDLS
jgi:hypothetical protein